jgi:hypothetical protein
MAKKQVKSEPPSRRGKNVRIPADLWDRLDAWAKRDERTTNSAAAKAIRYYLLRVVGDTGEESPPG